MVGEARARSARSILGKALLVGAVVAVVAIAPAAAAAKHAGGGDNGKGKDGGAGGAVYTATNGPAGNQVVAFTRRSDGSLTLLQTIATGGLGTASQPPFGFPINDSSGSINLTQDGKLLFVVNSGDNSVTSFRVGPNGQLSWADRKPSGGLLPISLTSNKGGNVLYALNELSGTIQGFDVSHNGNLQPINGTNRPLDPTGPGGVAAAIGFAHNDQVLVATQRAAHGNGVINTFQMHGKVAGPAQVTDSPAPNPFGFAAQGHDNIIVSHAGPLGDGNPFNLANFTGYVSSFRVNGSGSLKEEDLQLTSPAPSGRAACWVVITDDQKYAYVTNTLSSATVGSGDGAVSIFSVGHKGKLTFLGRANTAPGFTSDEALSSHSQYLYTVVASIILAPAGVQSTIAEFRVGPHGSLTFLGTTNTPLPPGVSGIAAS
jgi:6-phosphogluconolactonase